MHVFTDVDWAGYVMVAAGGPLAWESQLQATSSMQNKYQGMYVGMQVTVGGLGGCCRRFYFLFPSFVRTHAFHYRQSECRGPGDESCLADDICAMNLSNAIL